MFDRGFWAAFTLYPQTKMGNERMVGIARRYGSHHIFIDSSADWGKSDPLAVPKTARLMLERGIPRSDVEAICYGNALAAFGHGLGAALFAFVDVLPFGWRALYAVGALPLLALTAMRRSLRETARFEARRRRRRGSSAS